VQLTSEIFVSKFSCIYKHYPTLLIVSGLSVSTTGICKWIALFYPQVCILLLHFGTVFYLVFYFLCITSSVSRTSHFLVSTFFYHFLMIKMVMWQDHAKDLLKAINESLLTHPQIYQLFHNELEVQDNSHQNHLRLQRQHLKSQKQNNVRGSNEKLMINTWQQWVKIVINIT